MHSRLQHPDFSTHRQNHIYTTKKHTDESQAFRFCSSKWSIVLSDLYGKRCSGILSERNQDFANITKEIDKTEGTDQFHRMP